MKAFATPVKGQPVLSKEDRKLKAEFDKQHDGTFFNESFCNANQFKAFRRQRLVDRLAYDLFQSGKIDLFHQDNIYDSVQIVDTDLGKVLTLPFEFEIEDLEEFVTYINADDLEKNLTDLDSKIKSVDSKIKSVNESVKSLESKIITPKA